MTTENPAERTRLETIEGSAPEERHPATGVMAHADGETPEPTEPEVAIIEAERQEKASPRILSVTSNTPFLKKLDPLLRRACFEVDRMPLGEPSLILASQLRYDLFLIVYPIPDMGLDDFLAGVHAEDSPCSDTPVLILAEPGQLETLYQRSLGRHVRMASVDQAESQLEGMVSNLLGVAHRVPIRIMVQLEVQFGDGTSTRLCQTENISESGMLLRTQDRLKIGTVFELGLRVPDDDEEPVAAKAEVVRHAVEGVEGLTGIGVRFVELSPKSHDRLKRYLAMQDGAG